MLIFLIFSIILIVYGFHSFRKALILWASVCIFFNLGTCVKYSSPALTVTFLLNTVFFFLYLKSSEKKSENFSLLPGFVFITLSYIITNIFEPANWNSFVVKIINDFVVIFIIYKTLNYDDYKQILRNFFYIILISVIYGLFTIISDSNPIIEWESSLSPPDIVKIVVSNGTERGMKLQSFFSSSTDFTIYISLLYFLLFFSDKSFIEEDKKQWYFLSASIIILFLSIISKNRASIVGTFALVILAANYSKRTKDLITVSLISSIFIIPFIGDYLPYLFSFFSDSSQDTVGGSTTDMRVEQLNIVLAVFPQSPICGLGFDCVDKITEKFSELYGAESLWFRLLLQFGLLGVISYIYLMGKIYFTINADYRKRMFIYMFFWLIINSVTLSSTGLYPLLLAYLFIENDDKITAY